MLKSSHEIEKNVNRDGFTEVINTTGLFGRYTPVRGINKTNWRKLKLLKILWYDASENIHDIMLNNAPIPTIPKTKDRT